ncbi:MAG: CRTAC1 family protein [Gemmatimonadetes bacterium]|nr:CRTAC1 family protein [Gemmatimonadota bacterium]MYB68536.1 CRTAC1 family protein [Gemmatimonadota bacterium]
MPYVLPFLFLFTISASYAASLSQQESHRKMVALLAEVRAQNLDDNPYQGEGQLRQLEDQLQALPDAAPVQDRIRLHFRLGIAELFLGRERRAIDHLTAAEEMLAGQHSVPAQVVNEIHFRLGLAWLRLGETQNCVLNPNAEHCILPIRPGGFHTLPEGSRQAIPYFQAVLDNTAAEERLRLSARWLLNIAYMTLGQYPEGVPPAHRIPPEAFESQAAFPHWVNVAPALGLDTFSLSGGAVADDFDSDGYLDFFVSTSDLAGQLRFFRNGRDGTFADRTEAANLNGLLGGLNLVQADYDNDGHLDLLVLRGAWFGEHGQHPNSLLRNAGDGTFCDATFAAGLGQDHYPTQTAAWADYDLDGDLDLYIGNETTDTFVAPGQLFHNQGDGTFADVAPTAGVDQYAHAKAVVWGDYDGDRWPDLYVSNLGQPNRLYHNQGDGTFADVAPTLGVVSPRASFPAWFWDFDNDGHLDLFVAAYSATIADITAAHLGHSVSVEQARLYRGDGQGGFADVSQDRHLAQPTKPMGANFGDLDHDGFLDFYLGTGDTDYAELMPNVLYWNQAGQRFVDVTFASGLGHLQKGHGVVFADLDHDGDVDIFEQMGGAYRGDGFADVLYENPGFGHGWLAVEVVGVESNRSGIGTQLRVDVVEGGQRRSLYRWVGSGGSFGGNPLRQYVGLGSAERVAQLVVFWPKSGREQVFAEVPVNAIIRVTEGRQQLDILALPAFKFAVEHPKRAEHHLHK